MTQKEKHAGRESRVTRVKDIGRYREEYKIGQRWRGRERAGLGVKAKVEDGRPTSGYRNGLIHVTKTSLSPPLTQCLK